MKLRPLNDSIIFEFLDDIRDGTFVPKTKSGIILTNQDSDANANNPRWGKVYAVGPEIEDIITGEFILVAPLRWTPAFKFDGNRYSKTIEKEVLLVANEIDDVAQLFI